MTELTHILVTQQTILQEAEFKMETTLVEKIANGLSSLTIFSCLFLKVPQIMQLKEQKSAEGIYVESLLMEITGFTIMSLYNFTNGYSILTYLEYPIILVQIYVLLYYVLKFKKLLDKVTVPVAAGLYVLAGLMFMCGCLPKIILSYIVPFCTPLSGFAKVTYIYSIVVEGKADAVSLTTWMISIGTNLARIFTVYVDSADITLMINFFVSTMLSTGVLGTALYYQRISCNCRSRPRRNYKPHRNVSHVHAD